MATLAERQVAIGAPSEVEPAGIVELGIVSVSRCNRTEDQFTARHTLSSYLHVHAHPTGGGSLNRARKAKQFFHCRLRQSLIGMQPVALGRVLLGMFEANHARDRGKLTRRSTCILTASTNHQLIGSIGKWIRSRMKEHTGLAVIEARWFEDGNDSVRPFFEVISGIVESNPHAFRYDMFTEEQSLASIIEELGNSKWCHSLYIAAHGSDDSIFGLGNHEISRTKLRNMIRSSNTAGNITGLYFGSCSVASTENCEFFFQGTNLRWIAGYDRPVDWVDSSAIDMVFWSKYLNERKINRSRRRGKRNEVQMAWTAADEMKALMPTASESIGFNLYRALIDGEIAPEW